MRDTMITRFFCSNCGKKLKIKSADEVDDSILKRPPGSMKPVYNCSLEVNDPTGYGIMYNPILVTPCKFCIDKELEPARKVAEGIIEMSKLEGK